MTQHSRRYVEQHIVTASAGCSRPIASRIRSSRPCAGRTAGASSSISRLTKAPIATEAVRRIGALFAIEHEINDLAPQDRLRVRHERLIVQLEALRREQGAKLSKSNDTTKAINCCLSRWNAFTHFVDDGHFCMSNNVAERELRAVAVKKLDLRRLR
ncbi:IS66 family transposase [Bradyrhizobium sp. DASA03068]|uniref:IS66 family transposase n=1 Tax=Bradyrhizobium sp. BLXBL-01 TaxID=3395915 RepID=UPI003F7167DE